MTKFCICVYRFFKAHRLLFWLITIGLFAFFGYFSMQIHLEEDLNKLMPASQNPDGTTKLAFADLKIKDKTFLLFEGENGASADSISAVCDEFVATLDSLDKDHKMIADIFSELPQEKMLDAVDYVTGHLPAFIDTTLYGKMDALLTEQNVRKQMQQNSYDLQSEVGDMFPELIQIDPLGIRNLLKDSYSSWAQGATGGYITVNNHFFVPDSTVCVVFLTPAFSATNTGQGSALFEMLNAEIQKVEARHPNVKVSYHGDPASGFYNSSTIKGDLAGTVGYSMLLVLVFLFFCFKDFRSLPLLVVSVTFGTLCGLAFMYFIRGQFSLMALGIGAIVLGVAMSYVLHILTHHQFVGDPEKVLEDEVKPVMLGCITTIGSMMGLFFVDSALLQDFGLFAVFAIVGTTLFSLLFLPQMLTVRSQGQQEQKKTKTALFSLIERFNACQFKHSALILSVIGLVTVVSIVAMLLGGSLFDPDINHIGYIAPSTSYSENLLRSKTFTGEKEKYFAASGATAEDALENFSRMQHTLDSLQRCGMISSYTHTTDLLIPKSVQQERIDAWKRYWTPERIALARRLVAKTAPEAYLNADAFEPFFDLAESSDLTPDALYEADILPAGYLSTLMEKSYGDEYLCFSAVRCKNDDSIYTKVCDVIAPKPHQLVLDTYYYTTSELQKLNSDFNTLQWISMAFVFVVLLLSFRFNIKYTLLGFAPILLSWFIVLGAMVIFDYKFNIINIVISSFIFGMGVDYSIFVMAGLISASRSESHDDNSLHYHKTAITLSAVILFITVASMMFARHPAIQSVGFCTFVGLVAAVVISYVAQPIIFAWMEKGRKK